MIFCYADWREEEEEEEKGWRIERWEEEGKWNRELEDRGVMSGVCDEWLLNHVPCMLTGEKMDWFVELKDAVML